MHLDKLELLGFKSFPEKTSLVFSPGISAIVGPNGCGKTNILDALRWVLGETRMSILRGGKLEEVIFSGTTEIKPLGLAEVNLTIQNDKGILASPYRQITITRRLYRSGDAEFFINKVPCRLKDISEMFYDTGLTSGVYSVIEQDMIDVILSSNDEDRRSFFEQASGITKYKQRRKEALRKLENTEADLLRLSDLYSEVSSQESALRRQVSRAQKHKELQQEILKIGAEIAIDRWLKLERTITELASRKAKLLADQEASRAQERLIELNREKIKLALTEKENALRSKRTRLADLTEQLHTIEKQISILHEKSEHIRERHLQSINEIHSLEPKQQSLEIEIGACGQQAEDFSREVADLQSQIDLGEEQLAQKITVVQKISDDYKTLQEQIKKLSQELNENQENQITLDLKYSASLEKIEELRQTILQTEQELAELTDQDRELETTKQSSAREVEALSRLKDALSGELQEFRIQLQKTQDDLDRFSGEFHQLNATIEMTGKIIHQYEGYTSGAAQLGRIKEQFPGIIDTVANLINPQPHYQTCVQTVLGELSNYFVVDTQTTAEQVLAFGRAEKLGRFGLLILENIPVLAEPDVTFTNNPNIIGQLAQFVSADNKYAHLVRFLFQDILVARTLFDEKGLTGYDLVSPEGEMLDFEKTLAVGGTEEIMLVGRKAQYDELMAKKGRLQEAIDQATEEIRCNLEKPAVLESKISETSDKITSQKEALASINARLTQNELRVRLITGQLSEKKQIIADLENQIRKIDSAKSGLSETLSARRSKLEESEKRLIQLRDELEQSELSRDEFSRDLSNLKMKLFSGEASLSTARSNHRRLIELKSEIERALEEKQTLVGDLTLNAAQIQREIIASENNLETLFKEREESSAALLESEGEINEVSGQVNELEKNLKLLRHDSEVLSEQNHEIDLKAGALNAQRETLAADTGERYNCDLRAQSRVINLDEDQILGLEDQLGDLKSKLDNLGPVNLLALEEYDQTKARADFLKGQLDDLNKAKEDLRQTISRINATARKKFMETFELVKKNFQDVFSELFEGGEATLRLEENIDPLEAAIHISARPRGKKLLSIQQLSGGERALTAISLLFSFYMVKPSPFCILDEVDAPLDDANIGRFLQLVRQFTENTQFIIITHNKLTMEAAETLYGITMAKPGVSQIVSVDLRKADAETDNSNTQEKPSRIDDSILTPKPESEEEIEVS